MKKFFHMSREKLNAGLVLNPKGRNYVADEVEAVLEQQRPKHCDCRQDSVFLSETEDSSKHGFEYDAGYLHFAIPFERYVKRDNYWIGQLQLRLNSNAQIKKMCDGTLENLSNDDLAKNYWNGVPSQSPNWEIVCASATIDSLVQDDLVTFRSGGLLGALKGN